MPEPIPSAPRRESRGPTAEGFRDGLSNEANIARNCEFLAQNPEIGPALILCYDEAIERFPELGEVRILPVEDGVKVGSARSRQSSENKSGRNEVLIDIQGGAEKVIEELAVRPTTKKHFMDMLGVTDPSELTPTRIMAHVFLHELGHTLDYIRSIQNRRDYVKFKEGIEAEKKRRMPFPNVKVRQLLDPAYQAHLLKRNPNLFANLGVANFAQVRALNEAGYRQLPTEAFADQFAVAILHRRPFTRHSSVS